MLVAMLVAMPVVTLVSMLAATQVVRLGARLIITGYVGGERCRNDWHRREKLLGLGAEKRCRMAE
jgi:hypothetical protein